MKGFRLAATAMIAVCLVLSGTWILGVRSSPGVPSVMLPELDGSGMSSDGSARLVGDLTSECGRAFNGGALAIGIRTVFSDLDTDQGVMQTASSERGIFLEFQRTERHVFRLGVNTRDRFRRVLIARQTWRGPRDVFIVVKGDGSVSVTSGSSKLDVMLPVLDVSCDFWVIGGGNDLQDFRGELDAAWQFSSDPVAFDGMVREYRDALAASTAKHPRWVFVVWLAAAVVLFAGAVALSRHSTAPRSRVSDPRSDVS